MPPESRDVAAAGTKPAFITREPAEVYHARSQDFLTSHQLADFRKCPLLYRRKRLGLIPDADTSAYLVGRAAHTLILEGRAAFEARYAVGGPINPRTGQPFGSNTKAFRAWAESQGRPVLTDAQVELVERLEAAVRSHELAMELLADGLAEGVMRAEYCSEPCQIRMDWFGPQCGLVDLKTCDDLTWFEPDARRFGYVHQMAFYLAVLARAAGETFPVHIIAVEKKEPYRCGVWRVSSSALAIAQQENAEAIQRLKRCRELDHWPTGYERLRTLEHV